MTTKKISEGHEFNLKLDITDMLLLLYVVGLAHECLQGGAMKDDLIELQGRISQELDRNKVASVLQGR